jgi:DNA adenine methylase
MSAKQYTDELEESFRLANENIKTPFIDDDSIVKKVRLVIRSNTKAGIRAILACSLAKVIDPSIDIRKPYTEIGDNDSYSGRTIDEAYIQSFITKNSLPANQTTAWLTPAFRTNKTVLTPGLDLGGTPKILYSTVIELLNHVHDNDINPENLLRETVRQLLILKYERENRLAEMLEELGAKEEKLPLSSEEIIGLIDQHLNSPKSSRLPVLVITAAYSAAEKNLGENVKSLHAHNSPDSQTGAMGDVEIILENHDEVVTVYEMKGKEVKEDDIDIAMSKITSHPKKVDNYIFITTEKYTPELKEYADSFYRKLGGVEIAILDCIGFIRHFLHLFHRLRIDFLDSYQTLLLDEPESAVSQPLKEVFISLRKAAELSEDHE